MKKEEILIIYGDNCREMAYKLADAARLDKLIGDTQKKIGLKPNLVNSRPAESGATTHPEIAGGLIDYLFEKGFRNIVILEGAWAGARTQENFRACGYSKLAEKYRINLIDTQKDSFRTYNCKGMEIAICDSAMALDFLINLPVMKGHGQTLVTCALKNAKGIIPDSEKRRFHTIGLHKPIAHLNTMVRNGFILVDGICGDPDWEEGGSPLFCGRMYAGIDPVLIDAWTAVQMGYVSDDIPYIGIAEKLGVGSADPSRAIIRELNHAKGGPFRPRGKARSLVCHVAEKEACSSCYASLMFALSSLSRNELEGLKEPVCIGQSFKGKSGGIGVGDCTSGFRRNLPGCPPAPQDMLAFLRS